MLDLSGVKFANDDVQMGMAGSLLCILSNQVIMGILLQSMSINFAGHNVKLSLTHLEAEANMDDNRDIAALAAKSSTAAITSLASKDQNILDKLLGN